MTLDLLLTWPGIVIRLYSKRDYENLKDDATSAILHCDLKGTLLLISSMGYTFDTFPWFSKPPRENHLRALRDLTMMWVSSNFPSILEVLIMKSSGVYWITPRSRLQHSEDLQSISRCPPNGSVPFLKQQSWSLTIWRISKLLVMFSSLPCFVQVKVLSIGAHIQLSVLPTQQRRLLGLLHRIMSHC
jgi:hypothetical protein